MNEFNQHEVLWNKEKLARFWNFFSSLGIIYEDEYFSNIWGEDIIKIVKKTGLIKGSVLDFGCGPGHLMAKLIAMGITCEGLDFSEHSIDQVNQRFSGKPFFSGAKSIKTLPSDIGDASINTLFFIETIEHILPEQLDATLKEFSRIVLSGGRVVVTTPHNEHLERKKIICPDCGATFHRVQHIRSFTVESLNNLFLKYGFKPIISEAVTFYPRSVLNFLRRFRDEKILKRQPHHLIYIGRRI